jgi:hypothetical protein
MNEKRKAATPVLKEYDLEMTDTDDNDNVIVVQSARGTNNYSANRLEPEQPVLTDSNASSNESLFEKVRVPTRERGPQLLTRSLSYISETANSNVDLHDPLGIPNNKEMMRFNSKSGKLSEILKN